jgi:hypothetical protein
MLLGRREIVDEVAPPWRQGACEVGSVPRMSAALVGVAEK